MECFTVYADDIENRIDPLYLRNKKTIETTQTKYSLIKLGNLLKNNVQYGANKVAKDGTPEIDVRYIRISDIDEYGNLKSDNWKTTEVTEDKYILNDDDILFARSGATAGKCFIYKKEYGKSIFAGYLIRFVFDKSKVNPKYVFYYTRLKHYQSWVKSIQRPSGQPNINSEEFKSFRIPLPHIGIQNKFIHLMEKAYIQKKQKESEAHELLDSINDYVLDELEIKLPELKYKLAYVVNSDEIKNKRCDPYYYQPNLEQLAAAIKKGKFNVIPFAQLITDLKNGVEIRTYKTEGYRYLRVTDLSKYGINNNDPRFVDAQEIPKRIKLTKDDVLISRSGSLGLVSTVNEDIINAILSSHIFKVSIDTNKINSEYLTIYLRSSLGQFQFFRENNGGIVPEINQSALKSLKIILPSIVIQNKIVEEVKRRIRKAKQLQTEAKEEIEKSMRAVEKMILG